MKTKRTHFTRNPIAVPLILIFGLGIATGAYARGNQEDERPASGDAAIEETEETKITIDEPQAAETDEGAETQNRTPESGEEGEPRQVGIDRPAWLLVLHENAELMQEEVTQTIENGYIPTAMEVSANGTFTILYTVSLGLVPERWLIEAYNPEEINEELSRRFLEGWNPLGFSVVGGQLIVVLGSGGSEVEAWRIHESPLDEEAVQQTIAQYHEDGFSIVDMSIDPESEQLWYLFVRQNGRISENIEQLFLNAYPSGEATVAGISSDYAEARGMPYGLATGDAISLVLFTGNQTVQ